MFRLHLLAVAVLLIAAPDSACAETVAYRPEVGQPHPEILLPNIDTRQPVALSQFRGKKVLLIHFASW